MDIECKLHREGGTKVTIQTTEYHFAPLPDGAHVAAVDNEAHADRFLSISEAYKLYRGDNKPAKASAKQAPAIEQLTGAKDDTNDVLLGSDQHNDSFEINGKTYSLGDVVRLAHTASGLTGAEWNELAAETRADLIDEQLDVIQADKNGDGDIDGAEERAALAVKYEAKHGKKPQWNMNIDKLRAAVAE